MLNYSEVQYDEDEEDGDEPHYYKRSMYPRTQVWKNESQKLLYTYCFKSSSMQEYTCTLIQFISTVVESLLESESAIVNRGSVGF